MVTTNKYLDFLVIPIKELDDVTNEWLHCKLQISIVRLTQTRDYPLKCNI